MSSINDVMVTPSKVYKLKKPELLDLAIELGIDAKNLSRNELADVIRRHLEDGDLNKENRPIETPRVKKRGAAFKVIDNLLDHSEESNRRKEEDGLDKEIFESPANVFQEEPNFVQDEKDEQKCAELCEKSKPEIVIRKKRNWNPLKMVANVNIGFYSLSSKLTHHQSCLQLF
ncbi:hypothetical protein ROZALSC1DRAFT_26614 [Rozella allomycis CSF55]|uniref:Uncharacterized protein n=1 Tax=Rozella allomycis (strain CSF55) TaxID=988480 RepID=A0A075B2Z9_ROZAC|nr:hypothetical protein O9G_001385 [Rozella allomycis CSF55]RKP21991.1 hypothetical protein ROZALSC1DRAFT_26614 [Rozella allomycis CSF55]|eukprot:EPZ36940.1 hypothetical protein O9G_001385 [Rozella allomycis CSF55]